MFVWQFWCVSFVKMRRWAFWLKIFDLKFWILAEKSFQLRLECSLTNLFTTNINWNIWVARETIFCCEFNHTKWKWNNQCDPINNAISLDLFVYPTTEIQFEIQFSDHLVPTLSYDSKIPIEHRSIEHFWKINIKRFV